MEFLFSSAWWCWRFRSSPSWRWSRRSTSTIACAGLEARFAALEAARSRAAGRGAARASRSAPSAPPPEPAPLRPPTAPARAAGAESDAAAADRSRRPPPAPPAAAGSSAEHVDSFEEQFGTRWVVWIGGLALALGGIFLVHYSIEAGLIGPRLRLFFGALLAAALVAAGEWTRRAEAARRLRRPADRAHPEHPHRRRHHRRLCDGLCGLCALRLPRSGVAFVLLGVVALATLAAALLHGPALAALGLVGAYVTPLLVSSDEPNYWALYIYLAVVTAAAFALARMRLWRWLAITAVAFGLFWMLPGIARHARRCARARICSMSSRASRSSAALIVVRPALRPAGGARQDRPGVVGRARGLSVRRAAARAGEPARSGRAHRVHAADRRDGRDRLAHRSRGRRGAGRGRARGSSSSRWAVGTGDRALVAPGGAAGAASPSRWHADIGPHLALGVGFAALFGARGFLAQGRSELRRSSPILWARPAIVAPLAILIALYYRISGFERSIPFAGLALLLAALFGFATETLGKRAPRPGLAASGALFATGTVAALALALTFALEKGWLTVALALMVPGIAWIAAQRPLPMLRRLAAAASVLVLARIGWEPRIVGAMSAPRRSSTGSSTATACRRSRSGSPAICCASAPTTCRRAWSTPPRSCSPC